VARTVTQEAPRPRGGQREHPGLVVHRDRFAPGETTLVGDVRCTSPLRTAYDLARPDDPVEAVVGVDRLADAHRFNPDLLLNFSAPYRGARGNDRIPEVLARATPYSAMRAATPGWSTTAGGSTATRRSRCTGSVSGPSTS
jgi:hypothetical protein